MDGVPVRFGAIALDCEDPTTLGDFWVRVPGGEVTYASERFAAVRVGDTWLTAQKIDDFVPPTWPDGERPKQVHIDLGATDLEAGEAHVLAAGATKAATQPAPDRFRVYLDPAGHPFCVTTLIP